MNKMNNPLNDMEFLRKLDSMQNRQNYVRIISLDLNDCPRESIEGRVSSGTINVNGSSAVRRTCNLSLATLPEAQITDYYWVFDTKFRLEIGLKNEVDTQYPDIIWFNQGTYIINNFSASKTPNSMSISISGQDKMCRLNGDVSGNFMHQTDLGQLEIIDDYDNIILEKIKLKDIIINMLTTLGRERLENIIINDLDDNGYELWEYGGNTPIYFFCKPDDKTIINFTFDEDVEVYIPDVMSNSEITIPVFLNDSRIKYYSYYTLDPEINKDATLVQLTKDGKDKFYIVKTQYGETAGYHSVPLYFNTDLIANVNETITSVLDKIAKMLGDFEYFYDVNGRFIFQRKKTYETEIFSPITGQRAEGVYYSGQYSYQFTDDSKFTAFSTPPNLKNLKNDFSVWGKTKTASGQEVPIHTRYAIDKKPKWYHTVRDAVVRIREKDLYAYFTESINDSTYDANRTVYEKVKYPMPDNHIYYYDRGKLTLEQINLKPDSYIYLTFKEDLPLNAPELQSKTFGVAHRMADGAYRNYYCKNYPMWQRAKGSDGAKESEYKIVTVEITNADGSRETVPIDSFANYNRVRVKLLNSMDLENNFYYYSDPTKLFYTPEIANELGYEDSKGNIHFGNNPNPNGETTTIQNLPNTKEVDWRELIYQMAYDYNYSSKDFAYQRLLEKHNSWVKNGTTGYEQYYTDIEGFWRQLYLPIPYELTYSDRLQGEFYTHRQISSKWKYWNKQVHTNPTALKFWFDFVDSDNDLNKYSVDRIQPRTKAVNEATVKSIYYKDVPEVLFVITPAEEVQENTGYTPFYISETIASMFHRSSQGVSAITRTNDLIYQHASSVETINITSIPIYYLEPNTRIQVKGQDYKINTLSFQLAYNGTMNITGSKIAKQFI